MFMVYVPDWERLNAARLRVAGLGDVAQMRLGWPPPTPSPVPAFALQQAELDICRAIADRKIRIRFLISKEEALIGSFDRVVGTVRSGEEVDIPTDLRPKDFDWINSRPHRPWPRSGTSTLDESLWHLEWIEVCSADVTKVLCGGLRVVPITADALDDLSGILSQFEKKEAPEEPTATVAQESAAVRGLAAHLKTHPQITRASAAEWCKAAGYDLGARPFDRVWPAARDSAG